MRVVLDTSVLVAALRSRRGASNRLLELVAHGAVRPLVSTALFLEYEDVLMRAETRLATKMDAEDVKGSWRHSPRRRKAWTSTSGGARN